MKKKWKKEKSFCYTLYSNNQHFPQISISSQTILLHLLSNSPKKTHSKYHLPLSNTSISRQSSPKEGRPISQYCFFIIILNNSPWSNQIWIEPETTKSTVGQIERSAKFADTPYEKLAHLANVSELSLHKLWDRI